MSKTLTMMVVLLGFLMTGILLQLFLSKRGSRWPGLILPGLTFLWSLVALLNVAGIPGESILVPILLVLVLYNIPTAVLLAIYYAARERFRERSEMDKMQIKDL